MHSLRGRSVAIFLLCLGFSAVSVGCDTSSDIPEAGYLEFEYIEVDTGLLTALEQIAEEDAVGREPTIEFVSDDAPIKRFRSFEDYYTTVDLISEEARLTGTPIPIHKSLQPYLRFKRTIPLAELALVNHEGRLIVGDTLYSLQGDSYTKRHINRGDSQTAELLEFDPVQAMADVLTEVMRAMGVRRVTEALGARKSTDPAGIQSVCGDPDDFDFVSNPARNNEHTDMCVSDFNYPGIKVNPGDVGFTPNAPGVIVMWNTSYTTWTGTKREEAYTQFYKYRTISGVSTLDEVSASDLPQEQAYSTEVTVTAKGKKLFGCSKFTRSSTDLGRLYTHAGNGRCAGTGTRNKHTAVVYGVSGLPNDYACRLAMRLRVHKLATFSSEKDAS